MERLDAAQIAIPGLQVRVMARCASTNSELMMAVIGGPVLLATEEQTAGRGRRGRRWHSRPGDLTFSLARRIARPAGELAALPLVAGAAVAGALRDLGVKAALKWPNDLMVDGAKLGGILVETRQDAGATRAVFGIGINCSSAAGIEARVGRRVASLDQFMEPARNAVIRHVARGLMSALERFEAQGFDPVRQEWEAMHAHAGQRLRVRLADGRSVSGIADGLGEDGSLRLVTRHGALELHSGRVISARAA
jgi:BirA family biotin operon repressor/biotin-[acetyl-CoA-carboxylase] ligase